MISQHIHMHVPVYIHTHLGSRTKIYMRTRLHIYLFSWSGIHLQALQAALSEVEVFLKNPHEVTPKVVLLSFRVTLIANLLKFPFFEALFAMVTAQIASPLLGGALSGAIFATVTLPLSNLLYRRSMKLQVLWSKLYEAYLPTLLRDVAYGILRSYATPYAIALCGARSATPAVVFAAVFLACLGSSPFNQWRSFLLQHHSEKQPIQVYFKPGNYVGLAFGAAFRQGVSVGLGYLWTPAVLSLLARGR